MAQAYLAVRATDAERALVHGTLDAYREALAELTALHAADPARRAILADLEDWAESILPGRL